MEDNFGARIGGIFRRLLDVLEMKGIILKIDRDYITGDISESEWNDGAGEPVNKLSCASCDKFGIDCGSCEVDEDD